MKNGTSMALYIFALFLELLNFFSLLLIRKMNVYTFSLLDFTGIAVLCLPPLILFLILNNEKEFYHYFKFIVLMKLFSIVGIYLYFISVNSTIVLALYQSDVKRIILYLILPVALFLIDLFILVFSVLREKYLCKLFQ